MGSYVHFFYIGIWELRIVLTFPTKADSLGWLKRVDGSPFRMRTEVLHRLSFLRSRALSTLE